MGASWRNRVTSKRSSRTHVRGQAGRCLRSLTGLEALEPRRLLATFSIPADITRIDSTVHDGSEPIVKQGPGRLVLSAANLHTGGTVVEEGTLVVRDLGALGSGGVQVRAGATLVLDGGIGTFVISSLALDPGGRIDVGTSKLQVGAGLNHPDLLSAINTAKGDGTWNGTSGIGSSVVQKMGTEGTSRTLGWLGWAINDDSSFVVGFAAAGDTNLDGLVDVVDINTILSQMSGDPDAPVTWNAGDFNHDDMIDVMDLADLFGVGLLDAGSYLPAPPPATPRNLQALPLSTTSITLSWTNDDAPAGYEIERSADGITDWQPLDPETIQITGTSATISGFAPGERASFRVRAFAESPSWWWDDRYRSADTAAVAATAIPTAPVNVSARGITPTQSVVSWIPGPGLSDGAVVERQEEGDPEWRQVGRVALSRRFVIDGNAEPGQTYVYRVRSASNEVFSVAASPPEPVTMPTENPPIDEPPTDTDGDGISDVDEIDVGSNPDAADTDGDGVGDGEESDSGSDPNDPGSIARMDHWHARVEFTGRYGHPYKEREYEEQVKETKTLRVPASFSLPATLIARWSADDAVRVNGAMLGSGYKDSGSKIIVVSSRSVTVDLVDTLGGEWGGWLELALPAVDLSIDDLPEQIEDGTGAVIWRNSDFSRTIDAPSDRQTEPDVTRLLPDYSNIAAIDPQFALQFTRAEATFTAGMASAYWFRFDMTALGASAAVALWTTTQWEGFIAAADGWWRIPTGTNVRPQSATDSILEFWVEGIQATTYAAGSLEFKAFPVTSQVAIAPSDAVTFTVIDAGLGVDGDRDGTIDFADSYDRQLTFWLNDDHDVENDPGMFGLFDWYDQWGSPYETEDAMFASKDAEDGEIKTKRDLEDFASIHFLADSTLTSQMIRSTSGTPTPAESRPTYHCSLKLRSAVPNVRLFHDRPQSGPVDHVSITDAAGALAGDLAAEAVIGKADTILQSLVQPDRDGRYRYLFEALGAAGKTTLEYTVTVTYPQPPGTSGQPHTTSRTHTLDLDLRDITDFYTRMQVPYRLPNGADTRYAAFTPGDSELAHFPDAVPRSVATTVAMPFLKGNGTVVLVNGWNMTDGTQSRGPATDWKKAFAETAFKRLYWQGYRGEFASFDWPTFADSEGSWQGTATETASLSYNPSEFQAFRSGRSLMNFLNGKQANGPVHLLAHSMGNVVAAEALRQWTVDGQSRPLVTSYVAMQGAISAGAYEDDARDALDRRSQAETSSTDYYRNWPTGTAAGGSAYMEGTDQAAGKWINMFNPVDAATSGDFGWVASNLRKPLAGVALAGSIWRDALNTESLATSRRFVYRIDADGRLLRGYADAFGEWLTDGEVDLTDRFVTGVEGQVLPGPTAYEIIAFMAKANAMPIGTKEVGFFVRNNGGNIDINDLGLRGPFANQWSGHSFQFHFDAATTSQFWKRIVNEAAMDTVSKPRNP